MTISELWDVPLSFSFLTNFPETDMLKSVYNIHILSAVSRAEKKKSFGTVPENRNRPPV